MTTGNTTLKMTQRQVQKLQLKQIPGMMTVLKLRERLFSASEGDLEDFLLQFTEENHFLKQSGPLSPADTIFFPRFGTFRKTSAGAGSFNADSLCTTDILEQTVAAPMSLKNILTEQLMWERLSPEETEWGKILISGLDENGFWIRMSETGETFLENEKKHYPEKTALIDRLTEIIRRMDPPGAATKNRFESAAVITANNPDYPNEAVLFYRRLFELTEDGTNWETIPLLLEKEFGKEAVRRIGELPVPSVPGSGFTEMAADTPEAIAVVTQEKVISVTVPAERLLQNFQIDTQQPSPDSREEYRTAETVLYTIAERCRLLKAVTEEVLNRQLKYVSGTTKTKLRLTQNEIAQTIGIDTPKLSRLIKNKPIEIKLRDSQTESEKTTTADLSSFFDRTGTGTHSREEIRTAMTLLQSRYGILSDAQMSRLLKEQGIDIHRRTVCKYRSQINTSNSGGNHGTIHSRHSL